MIIMAMDAENVVVAITAIAMMNMDREALSAQEVLMVHADQGLAVTNAPIPPEDLSLDSPNYTKKGRQQNNLFPQHQ